MTDRPDRDLSNHFERLRAADVPDVWSRVVAEVTNDDVPPVTGTRTATEMTGDVNAAAAPNRFGARRWLGAAAAVLLVVGAIAGLVWSSGAGEPADLDSVDAPISVPTPVLDSKGGVDPTATVDPPTTAPATVFGSAIIDPEVGAVGDQFSLTPSAAVQPICSDPLIVRDATTLAEVGVIGGRADGAYGIWGEVDFRDCLPEVSADPVTHTIPDGLQIGTYVVCRTFELDESGCGTLTVTDDPAPTPDAFGDALITPVVTPAGFLVTLTPTAAVELICGEPGSVHTATAQPELLGLVGIGEASVWIPNGPDGISVRACKPGPSSAPASYRVPDELAPGGYILCRGFELDEAGCATITIIPLADAADPDAIALTTLLVAESGTVDGPVMRHPVRSDVEAGLAAEVGGVLELADGCLYLSSNENGERYPVLWPAETAWDAERQVVVLPAGDEVAIGGSASGGGGYHSVNDIETIAGPEAANLAGRCVNNTYGEIAVVNNYDTAIVPG